MDVLELGLAGKVAIVTGGSEGLGRACVERFAKSGAKVAVCARRKEVLERAVDEIQKKVGGDILAMSADVTNNAEVEAFVAATVARLGASTFSSTTPARRPPPASSRWTMPRGCTTSIRK